jgi:hypothetical protein
MSNADSLREKISTILTRFDHSLTYRKDAAEADILAAISSEPAAVKPEVGAVALPVRLREMFCTKCGYHSLDTEAPAGPGGAPCENSNCHYTAFVRERDFTAEQMHAYAQQYAATLQSDLSALTALYEVACKDRDAAAAEREALRKDAERLEALTFVGRQMATLCFNMSQWLGREIKDREASTMGRLYREWDAALAAQSFDTKGGE